jgi:hypothetical protein
LTPQVRFWRPQLLNGFPPVPDTQSVSGETISRFLLASRGIK